MQEFKNAVSWLVRKIKAGLDWIRENRDWLEGANQENGPTGPTAKRKFIPF